MFAINNICLLFHANSKRLEYILDFEYILYLFRYLLSTIFEAIENAYGLPNFVINSILNWHPTTCIETFCKSTSTSQEKISRNMMRQKT